MCVLIMNYASLRLNYTINNINEAIYKRLISGCVNWRTISGHLFSILGHTSQAFLGVRRGFVTPLPDRVKIKSVICNIHNFLVRLISGRRETFVDATNKPTDL